MSYNFKDFDAQFPTTRLHTKIYERWKGMWARCSNPSHKSFKNYGGRGIKVCDRWSTFEFFLVDMGSPVEGLTIERKDNQWQLRA